VDDNALAQLGQIIRPLLRELGESFGLKKGVLGVRLRPTVMEEDVFFAELLQIASYPEGTVPSNPEYALPRYNPLSEALQSNLKDRNRARHLKPATLPKAKVLEDGLGLADVQGPLIALFGSRDKVPTKINVWREVLNVTTQGSSLLYFIPKNQRNAPDAWQQASRSAKLIAQLMRLSMLAGVAAEVVSQSDVDTLLECLPEPFVESEGKLREVINQHAVYRKAIQKITIRVDWRNGKEVHCTAQVDTQQPVTLFTISPQEQWPLSGAAGKALFHTVVKGQQRDAHVCACIVLHAACHRAHQQKYDGISCEVLGELVTLKKRLTVDGLRKAIQRSHDWAVGELGSPWATLWVQGSNRVAVKAAVECAPPFTAALKPEMQTLYSSALAELVSPLLKSPSQKSGRSAIVDKWGASLDDEDEEAE
jgi:hypothetical protein